jgi:superfamily II DNA or RNA helicase
LALGFTKFLLNGGRCRFIINHILSEQDKAIILRGEQGVDLPYPLADYERLKASLDSEGIHFFNCLAWLIAEKRVEIVAIRAKDGRGIAHQKTGIFTDGQNDVLFSGSCNFTAMALLGNIENLSTRLSWDNNPRDIAAIEEEKQYFNQIFDRRADFVEYLNVEDIETAIQNDYGNRELNDLLTDEQTLIQKQKEKLLTNPKFKKRLEALATELEILREIPRFPHAKPYDYQIEAHSKWVQNGKQGILAMATGTGKTLTALNCLLEEWRETGVYQAVILVPTIALVEQWTTEIQRFNFRNIVRISSKEKWESEVEKFMRSLRWQARDENYLLICTYATFPNEKFQRYFRQLPQSTLFIADESHNLGSPSVVKLLSDIHLTRRIGLSATPERKYDTEGSLTLRQFFNNVGDYTYSFDMARAIKEKSLCAYDYFPHIVPLEADEMVEYIKISKKLLQYFDFKSGSYKESKTVNMLLQQRVRIIQKARNKVHILRGVLAEEFKKRGHLKYSFVFVPEGFETAQPDDANPTDTIDDVRLIEEYGKAIISIDKSIRLHDLTSQTKDRKAILDYFAEGEIHVLTSMKCLDEGVDIPRAELAVFCSSTGNPRQFIQRRGRVLRLHKDKKHATIHDLIVVPPFNSQLNKSETFKMEQNLMKRELMRVAHFVDLADNCYEAMHTLEEICEVYELNINVLREEI